MEAKGKGGSKSASKVEKKEPAPPKPDPVPAEPKPEPEKPAEDGASGQEGASEGGEGTGGGCEILENLKPFIIGGAIVALGAVLVGVILLAKKN